MADITLNSNQLAQYIPGSSYWTWKNAIGSPQGYPTAPATFSATNYNNLKILFENILTPLDGSSYGGKYNINSCLRKGTGKSQHLKGMAVDISHKEGIGNNKDLFLYIKDNPGTFDYDQLIWEGSDPKDTQYPRVIHISHDPDKTTQRRQVLWSPNYGTTCHPWDDKRLTGEDTSVAPQGSSEDKVNDQQITTKTGEEENSADAAAVRTWERTYQQALNNIASLEVSDVDVDWGQGVSPKDSDWISLKQYLLYLGTRYMPQSIYPFVELIPALTLDEASEFSFESDGTVQKDIENKVDVKDEKKEVEKRKQKLAKGKQKLKEFIDNQKLFRETQKLPPSISRTTVGTEAFNKASGISDLFNLDPFHEDFDFMGQSSEAGIIVKNQRRVGVRVYGQLVLSPGAIVGVPSKPGPIGFKELEIQAGAQCENGIALISMKLQDIQGNKFTDLASPWSFIYDARPGNIGGDFYFRYGWQVRCPNHRDISNPTSRLFWTHPGWKLFGDGIKNFIMSNLSPSNPCVMLTQAINGMGVPDPSQNPNGQGPVLYNMFDEGLIYDENDGTVTISRNEGFLMQNYVRLSLLNPELEIDENAAMTAKISFRTTGAIAQSIPLVFARTTRKLIQSGKRMKLGDLLLAIVLDSTMSGFFTLKSDEKRAMQIKTTSDYFQNIVRTREFGNLVYILGLEKGGNTGSIHPDEIMLTIDDDYAKEILTPPLNGEDTIIRWFRNVLEDNGCELNSAATGSGAGINAAWVITVTDDYDTKNYQPLNKKTNENKTDYVNALDLMMSEKDVFSYRFQGSLLTSINIEKTETPNALKIQMDYEVSDFETYKSTDKKGLTLEDLQEQFNSKSTLFNRNRNLRILFSQMQTVKISCMAHPWLGPGKKIFVKGMGFFDGEYLILEVIHNLSNDMNFKSEIKAARILLKDDQEQLEDAKQEAKQNSGQNISQSVIGQKLKTTTTTLSR